MYNTAAIYFIEFINTETDFGLKNTVDIAQIPSTPILSE